MAATTSPLRPWPAAERSGAILRGCRRSKEHVRRGGIQPPRGFDSEAEAPLPLPARPERGLAGDHGRHRFACAGACRRRRDLGRSRRWLSACRHRNAARRGRARNRIRNGAALGRFAAERGRCAGRSRDVHRGPWPGETALRLLERTEGERLGLPHLRALALGRGRLAAGRLRRCLRRPRAGAATAAGAASGGGEGHRRADFAVADAPVHAHAGHPPRPLAGHFRPDPRRRRTRSAGLAHRLPLPLGHRRPRSRAVRRPGAGNAAQRLRLGLPQGQRRDPGSSSAAMPPTPRRPRSGASPPTPTARATAPSTASPTAARTRT